MTARSVLRLTAVFPSGGYGQSIMAGIVRQLNAAGIKWSLQPVSPESPFLKQELDEWRPEVVLVQENQKVALEWCAHTGCPCVVLLGGRRNEKRHAMSASLDDLAAGRMAAEYFLQRGYEHFAFVGNGNYDFSLERQQGFEEILRSHRHTAFDFVHSTPEFDRRQKPRVLYHSALAEWLSGLPKPAAIFAGNDMEALSVIQACTAAGLAVPKEIAVLGAGDDKLICHLCSPEISSIVLPFFRVGIEAAKVLLAQRQGKSASRSEPLHLQPLTVITRESSRDFLIRNHTVRRAMDDMLKNKDKPIKIQSLLKALKIPRPKLEAAFRAEFGHTPLVQFRKLRIERAKMLLTDTSFTNAEIAAKSGFSSNIRFITVFKQLVGTTPSVYRESLQNQ
jgi:LacI family transcriptional regulator